MTWVKSWILWGISNKINRLVQKNKIQYKTVYFKKLRAYSFEKLVASTVVEAAVNETFSFW